MFYNHAVGGYDCNWFVILDQMLCPLCDYSYNGVLYSAPFLVTDGNEYCVQHKQLYDQYHCSRNKEQILNYS